MLRRKARNKRSRGRANVVDGSGNGRPKKVTAKGGDGQEERRLRRGKSDKEV